MANEVLIEAVNLSKVFGGFTRWIMSACRCGSIPSTQLSDLTVPEKTTLFNLSGVMPPTSGHVIFKGNDITQVSPQRRAHLGIGRSYQITNIFPNLTVLENIRPAAQAIGKDNFKMLHLADNFRKYIDAAEEVIGVVGLEGREWVLARNLPHGEKRKLELGIMIACSPELLLFDEPTAGMSSRTGAGPDKHYQAGG